MADETKRLKPAVISEDETAYRALQGIALYEPANLKYGLPSLTTAHTAMQNALREEALAEAALKTARDMAVASEWEFHNLMLGARDQVTAQFGRDSNEVQAVGRKKTSERKAPQRRKKVGGGAGS